MARKLYNQGERLMHRKPVFTKRIILRLESQRILYSPQLPNFKLKWSLTFHVYCKGQKLYTANYIPAASLAPALEWHCSLNIAFFLMASEIFSTQYPRQLRLID